MHCCGLGAIPTLMRACSVPQTKACVAKRYSDAGYDPVPTTPTDNADLAAAQQLVVDAQAAADAAQLALDNAARGPTDAELLTADTA